MNDILEGAAQDGDVSFATVGALALLVPAVQDRITADAIAQGLTSFTADQMLWTSLFASSDFAFMQGGALVTPFDAIPDTVQVIVTFTDMIEQGLGAHMNAVGALSMELAANLNADAETIVTCGISGQLHDIGKVVIPANIIRKSSGLNAAEYAAIKFHSRAGDELLRGIPPLVRYAPIVRSHHERIDGAGYPDGIAGDDIPFESRIIAVADAFDAMTSKRVYRAPMSSMDAIRIIVKGRGQHFEASVVDALLDVMRVPTRHIA